MNVMNITDLQNLYRIMLLCSLLRITANPPFVGHNLRSNEQKDDLKYVFGKLSTDKCDYVIAWFYKAALMMKDASIKAAFVATNSICQGVSVGILWEQLFQLGIHISFAWETFKWDSEASDKAQVHVVIIGFENSIPVKPRLFNSGTNTFTECEQINGYLTDAPEICVTRSAKPLCDVPTIRVGSLPRTTAFTLTTEDKHEFILKNPLSEKWIKPYIGSDEFLKSRERYCLWLKDANISEVRQCPMVLERIEQSRADRLASPAAQTRRTADKPMLFAVDAQPETNYLLIPQVSSERRRYLPIGFMPPTVIASNLVFIVPDATLYHFGILTSNVHNAWMRAVCGRLEMRYRYSGDMAYNAFPWPNPTEEQKAKIEQTAQAILDARALYPDSSLADLYDELTMPPELRTAHQNNDRAVMAAYGMSVKDTTESSCVAELMRLYQELVSKASS